MVGTRVYIGGLPYGVREKDLERFFKGYGRIRDVLIKNGYGFVEFDDYRDADDAVYELNGKELLGERVIVEHARGTARRGAVGSGLVSGVGRRRSSWMDNRHQTLEDLHFRYGPPTRTEYRLIVENLSSRVSWQDLKDYMRQAGEVTYADAHKQRRNEGVVEFATYTDMRNAIDKLDDTDLNGRRIRLVEDTRRRRRSRSSSSRSRSRSRRRSRSRSRRSSRSRSRSRRSHSSRTKSRSKSRERGRRTKTPASRSRSRSRSRRKSRSKSKSKSHDRSKSKTKSRSRSRSRSPSHPKSRSQSKSKTKSESKERSHSRSPSKERSKSKSRSPSKSPEKDGDKSADEEDKKDD
ncbi:serine-arginine protein 55 isoform X12 [Ischnura elegans]|uniref:serine-arginine protein 55 isoform X12 n=1 Tax=Ischnura elegans TaxID=197161 RepID=UPI001ED8682E|nr:serine-arginine protein 55 isoform X12 [Ischnura elegans]